MGIAIRGQVLEQYEGQASSQPEETVVGQTLAGVLL